MTTLPTSLKATGEEGSNDGSGGDGSNDGSGGVGVKRLTA